MRQRRPHLLDAQRKPEERSRIKRSLAGPFETQDKLKPGRYTGKRKAAGLRGLRPALQGSCLRFVMGEEIFQGLDYGGGGGEGGCLHVLETPATQGRRRGLSY